MVLRAGHGSLYQAAVVAQTFISVGEHTQTGLSLSPISGTVPLTTSVTFPVKSSNCTSYEVKWGDGTIDQYEPKSFTNCNNDSGTDSLTHTYLQYGSYDVTFKSGNALLAELPLVGVWGQWTVLVEDNVSPDVSLKISPTKGLAPLAVTASVAGYGESCTSYYIDWGDGSVPLAYEGKSSGCYDFTFKNDYTHTYTQPGIYRVYTKVGHRAALIDLHAAGQNITVGTPGTSQ